MLNLPRKGTGKLKLHVIRQDGFNGPIQLSADDPAFRGETTIPADQNEFTLNIGNSSGKYREPFPVRIEAMAQIDGKKIRKPVVPCDEFIQAFAYTHLLPTGEFYVGTVGGAAPGGKKRAK